MFLRFLRHFIIIFIYLGHTILLKWHFSLWNISCSRDNAIKIRKYNRRYGRTGLGGLVPQGNTSHSHLIFIKFFFFLNYPWICVQLYIYIYWNCYSSKGKSHPNGIIFVLNEEQLKISYDIIIPLKTAQRDRNY